MPKAPWRLTNIVSIGNNGKSPDQPTTNPVDPTNRQVTEKAKKRSGVILCGNCPYWCQAVKTNSFHSAGGVTLPVGYSHPLNKSTTPRRLQSPSRFASNSVYGSTPLKKVGIAVSNPFGYTLCCPIAHGASIRTCVKESPLFCCRKEKTSLIQ